MSGPDIVEIRDLVAVTERAVETVTVGYTQITSEGSHSHTAAAVGADPAGTAAAAVTAHAAAADPHPGYLTTAEGDSRYAALGASGSTFPLAGYGLLAATGDPMQFFATGSVASGQVILTRAWIPANVAINSLWCAVRDAGTFSASAVHNRLGVYADDGTLVTTTPDDNALWSGNGWRGAPVAVPVAAQPAGRFVYLGVIFGGYSGVNLPFPTSATDTHVPWFAAGPGGTRRRAMYANGQTTLPGSFNPGSFGTPTTFMPLIGVS